MLSLVVALGLCVRQNRRMARIASVSLAASHWKESYDDQLARCHRRQRIRANRTLAGRLAGRESFVGARASFVRVFEWRKWKVLALEKSAAC